MHKLTQIVVPWRSPNASLELVGGKGAALSDLSRAEFPVPQGFFVSTAAYDTFVKLNDLNEVISQSVGAADLRQPEAVRATSAKILARFQAAPLPPDLASSIGQAIDGLGGADDSWAVRSSATTEDLPELSFAGQHESFLNVRGEDAILQAVRQCWSSLWTARAIAYRQRMNVEHTTVAMAVVVQKMVPAEVSGVLFTANPHTGDRNELVLNASPGLGEAIVAGEVTPDQIIFDREPLQVKSTESRPGTLTCHGNDRMTERGADEEQQRLCLPLDVCRELAELGLRVERLRDGVPQDMEWAVAHGKCWVLQSRPITHLPSQPLQVTWEPPTAGEKLIRRQVVEHMPEPLSPLFDELYLQIGLEQSADKMMDWFDIPFEMEDFVERPMFLTVNGYAYCRGSYKARWWNIGLYFKVMRWYLTSLRRLIKNVIPHWRDEGLPAYLATVQQWDAIDPQTATDQKLMSGVRALALADALYWLDAAMVLAMSKLSDGLLNRYLRSWAVRGKLSSAMFLRGLNSAALQSRHDLEAIAERIRISDALRDLVLSTPAHELQDVLRNCSEDESVQAALDSFFQQHGHQIYNLDFAVPTQVERPLPILHSLQALVRDPGVSTAQRQADMSLERETLETKTTESLGPIRRRIFKKLLGWAQSYAPCREEALSYMGAGWPTLRRLGLELGGRLVQIGTLSEPGDIFFLEVAELVQACAARKTNRACPELRQAALQRRELREARKRLHPPGMVPKESRFKIGPFSLNMFETQKRNADDASVLQGFAVSPGTVTGPARVILSLDDFERMQPDSILVCPTTTPGWTPLFDQALALVTDVGGILAHGSIVAREFGIPAVLGTGTATQRIRDGQLIVVDGDAGTVTLLD